MLFRSKVTPLLRATITEAQLVHPRQSRLLEPDELAKEIRVTALKGTDLIRVSYQHPDPSEAARVVNILCKRFAEENIKRSRKEATETLEFLEAQNAQIKRQLERDEQALEAFKVTHRILDLKTDMTSASDDLGRLERLLRETELAIRKDQAHVRILSQKLDLSPDQALRDVAVSSHPTIQKLQAQLVEAQTNPILTSGVGEAHPEVRALRARIASLEELVVLEAGTIAGQQQARMRQVLLDPLREQLARELVTHQIDLVSAQVRRSVLEAQLKRHGGRVSTLSRAEQQFTKLSRERTISAELYQMFLKRREQARVAQAMEFGNVRIVQPAEVPRLPVKPNLPQSILASGILGLILASGGALAVDHFDDTLRNERRVRLLLGQIPLIGRLPRRRQPVGGALDFHMPIEERDAYGLLHLGMIRGLGPQFKLLLAGLGESDAADYVANLAVGFAQQGRRVLLVEGDMRHPVLGRHFALEPSLGLRHLLTGEAAWADVATRVGDMSLWVVPATEREPDPFTLLNNPRLWALSQALANYDIVLGIAPGVTQAPDALAFSGLFDHFWLVLDLERDTETHLQRALALLAEMNMHPGGAIAIPSSEA